MPRFVLANRRRSHTTQKTRKEKPKEEEDERKEWALRTRFAFDKDAAEDDGLNKRTQASLEAFMWFEARTEKPPGVGWHFMSSEGWTEFGPEQQAKLEASFVSTNERLCALEPGHNLKAEASVDFDRMLLIDPELPDFAAATTALPSALPVTRRAAKKNSFRRWRKNDFGLDASDSEFLTLARNAHRPCLVLYATPPFLVDLQAMQWADCLSALGYVRRHGSDQSGAVSCDDLLTENDDESSSGDDESSSDETENEGLAAANRAQDPRTFQEQVEALVTMGFSWKDAQWALSKASTLEGATDLLLAKPRTRLV